ncbi:MAG: sodium:alanine symporter family protein [Halieaceae bacterium]
MVDFVNIIDTINSVVWGPVMLVLILGTGLYLSIGLRFMTIRRIPAAFGLLFRGIHGRGEGEISPFGALMTALSATIGTGNLAGVATAIAIGGPGALFWMWLAALVGIATKYAEAVLAVHYREHDAEGRYKGGPMYYIKNGLKQHWHWLGFLFAIFGGLAGFGIANTVQSNSVAQVLHTSFAIPQLATGLVLAALVAAVILGGIRRIAHVTSVLVPFMAIAYLLSGLALILMNISELPAAAVLIIDSAFNGHSAAGGFAGATMLVALRMGVARGIFSNEAGLGSAPIAHAAAQTNDPVRQGTIAMLGTFIDTLVICTITGFAIVMMGVMDSGETGANLTRLAFERGLPGGEWVVTFGLCLFAFTTMIGWSYYGERCVVFLFGERGVLPFRLAWVCAIPLGTVGELDLVWKIADILNACMAFPNLAALLLLAPVVFRLTREYLDDPQRSG